MKNTILLSSVGGGNTHTHTHTHHQEHVWFTLQIPKKERKFIFTMKKTFIMLQTIPQIILKKEVKLSCFNDNNQKCNLSTKSAY